MDRLDRLTGTEQEQDAMNRALRDFVQQLRAATVGAVHVTCADESVREAGESFQHWFVEALLPELKPWTRSPVRTANLGARYEWGSVRWAEQYFATPASADSFKLLVVKINSHVSLIESAGEITYGRMDRYGNPGLFCEGLHMLLDDRARGPAADELREVFSSEGKDRLAVLRDPQQVEPAQRGLMAAVVNARLQARQAIVDIQDYRPRTPTIFAVLPCVTIDRTQRNTELMVGMYWADFRDGTLPVQYRGLGDDPSRYRVQYRHGLLCVEDDQLRQPREARNHRQEILRQWQQRRDRETVDSAPMKEISHGVARMEHHNAQFARETLKTLLWSLADVAPVPAAVLLFAKGAASIHHLYRVQRLAQGINDHHTAKAIIGEVAATVDAMTADQARGTIDALMEQHQT
jgi:hypothetical protein